MKEKIDVLEHATEILQALQSGVLLVTKDGAKVNAMTISWGALGIDWRHPVFKTFVRESRFTRGLLDKTGMFNIAVGTGEQAKQVLGVCGSKSGRDLDKIKECGLTLECRVVYKQQKDPMAMTKENREQFYPEKDGKCDNHILYVGEIVAAYRVK